MSAGILLAACVDPYRGVDRVSEVGVPDPDASAAAALPSEAELAREGGFFTSLVRQSNTAPEAEQPITAVTTGAPTPSNPAPEDDLASVASDPAGATPEGETAQATAVNTEFAPTPRRRVFGWLRNAAEIEPARAGRNVAPLEPFTPGAPRASIPRRAVESVPNPDLPLGQTPAFGDVVRVCEIRAKDMGPVIDEGARKGRGYKLHDSAPGAEGPRPFYITGFKDNCPRQITAAIALFGSPQMHEQLRYGLPAEEYSYSTTDKAYEKVKRNVCNVGRSKPCGVRVDRIERMTVFVSAYENFGENARWADMLIHDGVLLATSLKTP